MTENQKPVRVQWQGSKHSCDPSEVMLADMARVLERAGVGGKITLTFSDEVGDPRGVWAFQFRDHPGVAGIGETPAEAAEAALRNLSS